MVEIILKTGVKITQNKNGNITKLISPYDDEISYGQKCVNNLKAMFKNLQEC